MRKTLLLLCALLLLVSLASEVGRDLLLGWLLFLARVLPRASADGGSLAVGAAAVLLFTAGMHLLGRAWARTWGGGAWKLRWSLAGVGVLFLLFAAGTCLVALVHQVGWLATAREPRYVPALAGSASRRSETNLRQIGLAAANYHDTHGALPPGGTFAPDGTMRHGWAVHLLTYLNYSAKIDLELPWNHPRNQPYFQSILPELINPQLVGADLADAQGYGLSHYAANVRVFAVNRPLKGKDFPGSLSSTVLVGEVNAGLRPWGHPLNVRDPARGVGSSPHGFGGPRQAGGANFVMGDGSVRFVGEKVGREVLDALATPGRPGE
jgi:prepilin-type processing-associated H-X9-DG protein